MHFAELTDVEQRVLGCLIEKRWTTPDQYPLSLNALRLACNQATNRDPVTDFDENAVRDAAQRLSRYGLARLASGAGSRATKYRHLAEEGLGLDRTQLGVLCVMLLRGAQTPGELKSRSERLAHLASLADVERTLDELIGRGYVVRIERRPGQKEDRFAQLLGGTGSVPGVEGAPGSGAVHPLGAPDPFRPVTPATVSFGIPDPAPADPPAPTAPPPAEPAPAAPASAPSGAPALASAPPAPATDHAELDAVRARLAALEADVAELRTALADLLE